MSNSTKFVMGLLLTVFVIALCVITPGGAEGASAAFDTSVRILSLLTGTWIAATLMYPFLLRRG